VTPNAPGGGRLIVASLARDWFVRTLLALAAVGVALAAAAAATGSAGLAIEPLWLRWPFHLVRIAAVFVGLGAIPNAEERRFWRYFGAAYVLWLLARLVPIAWTGPGSERGAPVLVAFVLFLGSLLILLAVERRPHERHARGRLDLNRLLMSLAVSGVAGGFFTYFVLVPALLAPESGTSGFGYLTYLAIDLLLVVRLLFASLSCRRPRWRAQYVALTVAMTVNACTDVLDMLRAGPLAPWTTAIVFQITPLLAIVAHTVAVRFRHVPLARAVERDSVVVPTLLNPLRAGSLLLVCAFQFPLIHFVVYTIAPPNAGLERAHSLTALAATASLGIGAALAYRVLERRHAAEERARRLVESRIQLAQRMEAAGQLAGGVAHDFNNLLMAVLGYADIARDDLPPDHASRPLIDQTIRVAVRAAELTRQVLAFSRQQVFRPVVLNLNTTVERVGRTLGRWLGEDVTVHISLAPRSDLLASVDDGQIESVLVSLAAASRDAMPKGGAFVIETRAIDLDEHALEGTGLAPGPYVELAVRDTGETVPPDLLPSLFEPFVAPLARSRGAGLQLAAVYGIVTQSGGHIWASTPRTGGLQITIVLPRIVAAPASARTGMPPEAQEPGTDRTAESR